MYSIELSSDYAQLYRYNIILSCAGYDYDDALIYVEGYEKIYNEHINECVILTPPPPLGFIVGEKMVMNTPDAHTIYLFIYVIAHTLPEDRVVENSPPFDLQVRVLHNDREIYNSSHGVNQWGGASINLTLKR